MCTDSHFFFSFIPLLDLFLHLSLSQLSTFFLHVAHIALQLFHFDSLRRIQFYCLQFFFSPTLSILFSNLFVVLLQCAGIRFSLGHLMYAFSEFRRFVHSIWLFNKQQNIQTYKYLFKVTENTSTLFSTRTTEIYSNRIESHRICGYSRNITFHVL